MTNRKQTLETSPEVLKLSGRMIEIPIGSAASPAVEILASDPASGYTLHRDARGFVISDDENKVVATVANETAAFLYFAAPNLLAALALLEMNTPVPAVAMGENFDDPFPLPDYIKQAREAIALATEPARREAAGEFPILRGV